MFAELLGTSAFSFLRGASQPEELVGRAKQLGLAALSICDRDGLYGVVRAFNQARAIEQRIVVGASFTLEGDDSPGPRASAKAARKSRRSSGSIPVEDATLALLVESHEGYQNLCRLLTLAHADRPKGEAALGLEQLARHVSGLYALVPAPRCPGDQSTLGPRWLGAVEQLFGERALLAVHRHRDGHDAERHATVLEWSERYGFRVVASARPLFHVPERKPLCDVLHCIRLGLTLDRAGTALQCNAEAYLRSEQQMLRVFADRPEWVGLSAEVAQTLRFDLGELEYRFPCSLEPGESADQKLRRLSLEGLARRYPAGVPSAVQAQIEKELGLIAELSVASYFLSTWEIVEMARQRRILCQGRGSAANSAVCYALGITAVDPARSNLLFERFLSAERREPPDIDIDFEHERREEVIQDIYERYGRERAAMVSEVISYRGKSALREVGKVFGLSLEQIERLSGTISYFDSAEDGRKRLREVGFDDRDERLLTIVALARELDGFPRHLSIHVGGFVLSAEPLQQIAPVEPARMPGRTVVPWDKDDLETLGFFKVDVLGLGMLSAIRKALALIHADGGLGVDHPEPFDPLEVVTRIPVDDPAVYELVSRADTVGVFQIESRAQMAMLPRLRPNSFYDLVIEVAIVRPGPIQGGMVHPYLRRRNGEERVRSPHALLEPILERTLGVPLFQEQVMQIAIVGAGYSGGEADQLRRDMAAWKKSGKLLRHRQRLLDGFARTGIAAEFGAALFEQIKGFGDYGFPESHAASFALLVYASAWQKAHYPAHFAAALLNAQPMGFYSAATILNDARRHGVEVRDVDVTCSVWDNTLEPVRDFESVAAASLAESDPASGAPVSSARALRLGLRQVKGLAKATAQRIEAERAERPFSSLEDVVRRVRLRQDELSLLAEAGAFDALLPGRRQALWQSRAPRFEGLFENVVLVEPAVELPRLSSFEQLRLDYRHKRLSVSDHPMRHFRTRLAEQGVLTASGLKSAKKAELVTVAGVVICRQQPGTASGVVFITLEDETGFVNLILWRSVYEAFRLPARHATMLMASGEVERQAESPEARHTRREPELESAPGVGDEGVIHVIVRRLERLDVPGRDVASVSRDFH